MSVGTYLNPSAAMASAAAVSAHSNTHTGMAPRRRVRRARPVRDLAVDSFDAVGVAFVAQAARTFCRGDAVARTVVQWVSRLKCAAKRPQTVRGIFPRRAATARSVGARARHSNEMNREESVTAALRESKKKAPGRNRTTVFPLRRECSTIELRGQRVLCTHRGVRTHDHQVKSLALYRLS